MNPVKAFVVGQFEKPNYLLAILFFLSQFIASAAVQLFIGGTLSVDSYAFTIGYGLLLWFLATVIIYGLLWAFKGKEVKGKFFPIASAFSITYLIAILTMVIVFLAVYFTFPAFFNAVKTIGDVQSEEEMLVIINAVEKPSDTMLFAAAAFSGIVIFMGFLLWLYVVYQIGNAVRKTGFFSNLVFGLVFLAVFATVITIVASALP